MTTPPYRQSAEQVISDALLVGMPLRRSPLELAQGVLSALSEHGYTLWRQMTEADEHYPMGDECDHDGEDWPCSYIRSLTDANAPSERSS